MSLYNYTKYKILIDYKSKKQQGLRVGDIVRRQYFDGSRSIYSLMIVLDSGVDVVLDENKIEQQSPYFIGALIEGDEPKSNEILDFVRVSNLFDVSRSGALYLTASDSESPFIDVIDGVATNKSLCYPYLPGGLPEVGDPTRYSMIGWEYLTCSYTQSLGTENRIFRVTRNATQTSGGTIGIKQTLSTSVEHPQRLVISYKIRASKAMSGLPVSFGYTNGDMVDGSSTIDVSAEWQYKLQLITVDYPKQYSRSFQIDLTSLLINENDWCEISDLNIVLLSDLSNFASSTKARIGKISGISDPVFGVLEGYGAYFQNLYATQNVNIAGTLTAGDENGSGSTFYVGKIHKNCIVNSIECDFISGATLSVETSPTGVGKVKTITSGATLRAQSSEWTSGKVGKKYCFSFWVKSPSQGSIIIKQNLVDVAQIQVKQSADWQRLSVVFPIIYKAEEDMLIRFDSDIIGLAFSSPQLEVGEKITQYQPTDTILDYSDGYGAWFNKGGIGGTIQNPILRFNEDGSVESKNGAFVIRPDGTGKLAGGKISFTDKDVFLNGITIRWEDMDSAAKEEMVSKSVKLVGESVFKYPDLLDETCEPTSINVFANETNFSSTDTEREWLYLDSFGQWKQIPGVFSTFINITPDFHGWEERSSLTIMYKATVFNQTVTDTFTLTKQRDGADSYAVYVHSSAGSVFRQQNKSTVLSASVYKGGEDVTSRIPDKNFRWIRTSRNIEGDLIWNNAERTGREITITDEDVSYKAVFDCEVIISTT